jgi:hypothetical protein
MKMNSIKMLVISIKILKEEIIDFLLKSISNQKKKKRLN